MSSIRVICKGRSHANNVTTSDLVFTDGYSSTHEEILRSVGILREGGGVGSGTWKNLDEVIQKLRGYRGEDKEAASWLISELQNMQGPTPSVPTQISIYIEEEKTKWDY